MLEVQSLMCYGLCCLSEECQLAVVVEISLLGMGNLTPEDS